MVSNKVKIQLLIVSMALLPWFIYMLLRPELFTYPFQRQENPDILIKLFGPYDALITGIAVVGASFLMAWATEASQFMFSQAFALAILALLQVFPEYMFEATLAWKRHIELASATMTGANRLLLGAGWPLIVFIAYLASKFRGDNPAMKEVKLDISQSVEIFFLVIMTAYSFVIVAKSSLDIFDAVILVAMYLVYLIFTLRMPSEPIEEAEHIHGPAKVMLNMNAFKRNLSISIFLLIGAVIIFFGAPSFIGSVQVVALTVGIETYFLAQWIAPLLSEFPESTSAFYYASTKHLAPMGMGNLVSSKVNQWSLLIGTIPLVYSLSIGHLAFIPLNELQQHEILLTGAQSAYGVALLSKMRITIYEAATLFTLWFIQMIYPPIRIEVTIIYLILAVFELIYHRKEARKLLDEFIRAAKYVIWRKVA